MAWDSMWWHGTGHHYISVTTEAQKRVTSGVLSVAGASAGASARHGSQEQGSYITPATSHPHATSHMLHCMVNEVLAKSTHDYLSGALVACLITMPFKP